MLERKVSRGERMLRTAMGGPLAAAIADSRTVEVMANSDGRLWVEKIGEDLADTGVRLLSSDVERVVRLVAAQVGRPCGPEHPIVSAEIPGTGERFEGVLPPVSPGPCFSIRKPSCAVMTLNDLKERGTISGREAVALRKAVHERKNILVAGGSSSGKTTLANALLAEASGLGERIVILEDIRELRCDAADYVALRTVPGVATLTDLVRCSLRLRPDRIVVGEVRGPEALSLLKAWNTGHPGGIATVHANSARSALFRIEQLAQEAAASVDRRLIAEVVDLIAFLERRAGVRHVRSLLAVRGSSPDGAYSTRIIGTGRPAGKEKQS